MRALIVVAAVLWASPARAFVFDGGAPLVTNHATLYDDARLTPEQKYLAPEINAAHAATNELRDALLLGARHGLQQQTSTPPAPDGGLVFYVHVSDGGQTYAAVQPDGGAFDIADALGPLIPANARTRTIQRHLADDLDERGINCKNFGAVCDGTTDDYAALQACFNAGKAGGVVILPPGVCGLRTGITVVNPVGMIVRGSGPLTTKLSWLSGTGTTSILKLVNSYQSTFEDFSIQGNGAVSLTALEVNEDVSQIVIYNSRLNIFRNLTLGGPSTGATAYGMRFTAAAGSDQNNDFQKIEHVSIANVSLVGISFEHSQTKGNQILDIDIDGCLRGVSSAEKAGNQGGSFILRGGSINNASDVAVKTGVPNDYVVVSNLNVETSGGLYYSANGSAAGAPVTIEHNRVSSDGLTSIDGTHPWHAVVTIQNAGTFNILGNIFGDSGATNTTGVYPVIDVEYAAGPTSALKGMIVGNIFGFIGASAQPMLIGLNGGYTGDRKLVNFDGLIAGNMYGASETAPANDSSFGFGSLWRVGGVSSTNTKALNLAGACTAAGSTPTCAVTFGTAEADTAYHLTVAPVANSGGVAVGSTRVQSVAKSTSGFTVTTEAAPGVYPDAGNASVTFDWSLLR